MRRLSLFVDYPFVPSVGDALPAITEAGLYSLHVLPLDDELLPLLFEARPCVCAFSADTPERAATVHALLLRLRELRRARGSDEHDGTLRLVLFTGSGHQPVEHWAEVGVHEIIIAPILPRALAFKLARHYQRALSAEQAHEEIAPPRQGVAPPGEERTRVPEDGPAAVVFRATPEEPEAELGPTLIIKTEARALDPDRGRWRLLPAKPEVLDGVRSWKWIEDPQPDIGKVEWTDWNFRGEEPKFNRNDNRWVFRGDEPSLTAFDKYGRPHKLIRHDARTGTVELAKNAGLANIEVHSQAFIAGPSAMDRLVQSLTSPPTEEARAFVARVVNFLESWKPSRETPLGDVNGPDALFEGEGQGATNTADFRDPDAHAHESNRNAVFPSGARGAPVRSVPRGDALRPTRTSTSGSGPDASDTSSKPSATAGSDPTGPRPTSRADTAAGDSQGNREAVESIVRKILAPKGARTPDAASTKAEDETRALSPERQTNSKDRRAQGRSSAIKGSSEPSPWTNALTAAPREDKTADTLNRSDPTGDDDVRRRGQGREDTEGQAVAPRGKGSDRTQQAAVARGKARAQAKTSKRAAGDDSKSDATKRLEESPGDETGAYNRNEGEEDKRGTWSIQGMSEDTAAPPARRRGLRRRIKDRLSRSGKKKSAGPKKTTSPERAADAIGEQIKASVISDSEFLDLFLAQIEASGRSRSWLKRFIEKMRKVLKKRKK